MSLRCQLSLSTTRNSLSRLGWPWGEEGNSFIIIILLNVFFGEERRRKPYTCPFSHDKEGEFKPHLRGLTLGLKH